ncbi:uncharacterized protein PG998_006343 [Apiospora kogelbergensis]|uniref:uncharacterized protein n=1 Tax=Apiospora kogelbergensis TaxID=1337665 RepID=UPI00313027B1
MDLYHVVGPYPALSLGVFIAVLVGLGYTFIKGRRSTISVPPSPTYRKNVHAKADPYPSSVVFPPSRRSAVAQLLPPSKLAKKQTSIDVPELRSKQLPTTHTQDLDRPDQYTPTGISTQEIKAMGAFPDYSVLSGVPYPKPCPSFDITKAAFRPFRPFRWTYHQTMAVMKMEPDYWLELESNYFRRMQQRQELLREHGEKIMFWTPGSELASRELMEMVVQFLCHKYPHYFQLEDSNTKLRNQLLETTTDLVALHPLEVLFCNVPEDYAVMCRNETDGLYYLRSAMICSSVGWNIGLHKNKVLRAIHDNVPQWEEKMAFSVDRWFTKLPTDQPVQRGSWGIEDWEAFFAPNGTPRSAFAGGNESACTVEDLQLRCDWQTLRRLPVSGAVIFNFKAVFNKLTDLRREPYVPALLHRVVAAGPRDLIGYKMERHVEALAKDCLAEWAAEQVADGLVPKDWDVGTLEQHPYFPGWKDKMVDDFPACPCV